MPLVASRKGHKVAGRENSFQGMFLPHAKDALCRFAEKESICLIYEQNGDFAGERIVSGLDLIQELPPAYYPIITDLMTVPDGWGDRQYSHWAEQRYGLKFHTVRRRRSLALMALAYIPNGLRISMTEYVRLKREAEDLCDYIRYKILGEEVYWVLDAKGVGSMTTVRPEISESYRVYDVAMEDTEGEETVVAEEEAGIPPAPVDCSLYQYLNDLDFWDAFAIEKAQEFYQERRDREIAQIDQQINLLNKFDEYKEMLLEFERQNLIITEVPDLRGKMEGLEERRRLWDNDLMEHFNVVKKCVDSVNVVRWAMQEMKRSWSEG